MARLRRDKRALDAGAPHGRMGGAVERVSREATAFGHRDANRLLLVVSAW